ncbi:MAG: rhodanese-like domain-containing protein [Acidobacteriota bacterium]
MAIQNLSVQEARARQEQGATLVDVRSTREYAAGHPAGAFNVPVMEHDEDTDQLVPNPDFVRVMQAHFPPTTSLLLSCQSGVRSVRASQMLESFGYGDVTNVLGGFGGARDGSAPGWQPSGLPVETSAGSTYDELLKKADAD